MTLRKLDIKVETVNREPLTMHSDREDDTASVSTATRVMKAIYSVSVRSTPLPRPTLFFTLLGPAPPRSLKLPLSAPSVDLLWSRPLHPTLTLIHTDP